MAEHNTGRTSSWAAVAVILVGFIVGGMGLILGPNWLMFWAGVAVVAVGGVFALAVGIMDDYG